LRTPKETKATLEIVQYAIDHRNLIASGAIFKINCPEEFKAQTDSNRCYYEGDRLYCKWDDLAMQVICGSDKTHACFCGNVVSVSRKESKK